MVAVTTMSRMAGMALVAFVSVVTRVRIAHGVAVLRLVAVVLVHVMAGVAVARCAPAALVIVVVATVFVIHTGLVSADVLRPLPVRAGSVCGFHFALDDPAVSRRGSNMGLTGSGRSASLDAEAGDVVPTRR